MDYYRYSTAQRRDIMPYIIGGALVVLGLAALAGGEGLILWGACLVGAIIGWGVGIYAQK